MQTGIDEADYLFLLALVFLLCCFFRPFWKSKHMLVGALILAAPLYGCAAGQVMVASYENESANCSGLDKELGVAHTRLQTLESKDSTVRNIRDLVLGVSSFIVPPIVIVNAILFFTDSYAADYTEKQVLKSSYNNMVRIGQRQGCGSSYALIPDEKKSEEPNA